MNNFVFVCWKYCHANSLFAPDKNLSLQIKASEYKETKWREKHKQEKEQELEAQTLAAVGDVVKYSSSTSMDLMQVANTNV